MTFEDLRTLLARLEAGGFIGYVELELGSSLWLLSYSEGSVARVLELPEANDTKVRPLGRLLQTVKHAGSVVASTCLMSRPMVALLSNWFAFKPLKPNELKKVLINLALAEFTGVLQFATQAGRVSILLDRGIAVTETSAYRFGEVLCDAGAIDALWDHKNLNGATIHVCAEKPNEIYAKQRSWDEQLEKIRHPPPGRWSICVRERKMRSRPQPLRSRSQKADPNRK